MAKKHCQMVMQKDPDNKRSRDMFKLVKKLLRSKEEGNTHFKQGKNKEAIEAYTACLALDETNDAWNSTLFCNRAAARMKLKLFKEAWDDCT